MIAEFDAMVGKYMDTVKAAGVWNQTVLIITSDHGDIRARSHCRFVLPLIHFIPDSLTYSVALFLKRQCDRTLGDMQMEKQQFYKMVPYDASASVPMIIHDARPGRQLPLPRDPDPQKLLLGPKKYSLWVFPIENISWARWHS
jgi:arylsulfatase A-like enzyme